ncbi:hypothetical protein [Candidatus Nitrosocosmicus hydrocola]|uniref:hypothetical protein n=1 Tax=Candidatus Nitrosocosmicus hydrocola TaxID=1826872 RepID=UPI0011E5C830|nr:hypothetical protein [Candidatus Nitrosocosmicus hydrocola]
MIKVNFVFKKKAPANLKNQRQINPANSVDQYKNEHVTSKLFSTHKLIAPIENFFLQTFEEV